MASSPIKLAPRPGIQRDGTQFDSDSFIDGLWTRFYRGRPKKIGGYQSIVTAIPTLPYAMSSYTAQNKTYAHLGSVSALYQVLISSTGGFLGLTDRVPAGLPADANRLWQFEILYDSAGGANNLIAHGPPNLNDISNENTGKIYYGDVTATGALVDTGAAEESGGIAAIAPSLFKFGTAGHIAWSVPNAPADFAGTGSGEAWVTPAKIIRGLPLRSGGNGPAGIFWSLDSLIRGSFVGSTAGYWAFDTLAGEISVLSSRCIIEYDGNYYWLGVDRAQMFNGVTREVQNNFNMDWFLNNLNFTQRQKVFAFKVPRYGEIWWCFPKGSSTECDHAIIYNLRENCWYDTALPEGGRSVGLYAKVYNKPFMVGVEDDSGFTMWQHETGVNKVNGADIKPVTANFQTNEISLVALDDQPKDKTLRVSRVEPDFVQAGDLTVTVKGRANARAANIDSPPFTIPAVASNSEEQTTPLTFTRRLMSFKFESNTVDGDFYMGKTIAHIEEADGRVTQ